MVSQMSADTLASSSLNAFGLPGQVQPEEEQIFVLTSAQLEQIISQAVARATAPLAVRLDALEDFTDQFTRQFTLEERGVGCREGGEEALQDLKGQLEELEIITAKERAFDRQRIAKLERVDPQPLQKDRGEILRALIAANGGKMLAKEARQKMRLSKQTFSMLLASITEYIETKPSHSDKRKFVLMLK
jgi:uncharacterized membrane protein